MHHVSHFRSGTGRLTQSQKPPTIYITAITQPGIIGMAIDANGTLLATLATLTTNSSIKNAGNPTRGARESGTRAPITPAPKESSIANGTTGNTIRFAISATRDTVPM